MADERELFQKSSAFTGQITASVTHELSNVLGTIEQVIGLIDDLALTEPVQAAGLTDRLVSVVGRIENQTQRGTELVRRLNKFAHLSDAAVSDGDLAALVENITALSQRFAGLKKVHLTANGLGEPLAITTDWLATAQVVFRCIQLAIQNAEQDDTIEIRLAPDADGAVISVESPREVSSDPGLTDHETALLAKKLGARLTGTSDEDRFAITLRLPRNL